MHPFNAPAQSMQFATDHRHDLRSAASTWRLARLAVRSTRPTRPTGGGFRCGSRDGHTSLEGGPPMPIDIDRLQQAARAATLRRLALRLENCEVGALIQHAGNDTWIGPTADRCRSELATHAAAISSAVTDLRARARRIDATVATAVPITGPY